MYRKKESNRIFGRSFKILESRMCDEKWKRTRAGCGRRIENSITCRDNTRRRKKYFTGQDMQVAL